MTYLAMLFYLGQIANAPVWYWVCWGISTFVKFVDWCIKLIKIGRESK